MKKSTILIIFSSVLLTLFFVEIFFVYYKLTFDNHIAAIDVSLKRIFLAGILIIMAMIGVVVMIMLDANKRSAVAERLSSQLSSMADIYISLYEINLRDDTLTEVRNNRSRRAAQGDGEAKRDCQQMIFGIMEEYSDSSSRAGILDFVDFSKLDQRLRDSNTATMEFLGKDQKWLRARYIVSQRMNTGKIAKLMFLIKDIDEERRMRDRLINMSARAIAASEAKSSFLSNMSHEIRTPINTMLGMNEMILRECSEENIVSYAENVRTAGQILLGLVNDILDFSKIEAGRMEIVPVDYDLSSVLNDLVMMIRDRAEEKGLMLELDFDRNIPKFLTGDEVRLKQIITNILTNAVKYTEKGIITFSVSFKRLDAESIMLNVAVKDTGIGIKSEDMKRLFSEFERIDEEKNREIEGTGLGMSITKKLLSMMGSHLDVKSTYGLGSLFSFSVKQEVMVWEPLGDYEASYVRYAGNRGIYEGSIWTPDVAILAVDDNYMNLMVFKNLLKVTGAKVDTAGSGEEGLALAENKQYDLIFLDHMMNGMDGIETLHEMKKEETCLNVGTPTICITANAVSGAREQYLMEGFDDYLMKPIDYLKLEEILIKFLDPAKVEKKEVKKQDAGELPLHLRALLEHCEIEPSEGVKNSGGVKEYLSMLKAFADSIDEREQELSRFYRERDLKSFAVKVHALKSSARIIGAQKFGMQAGILENAAKHAKEAYIGSNLEAFLAAFRGFKVISLGLGKESGDGARSREKAMAAENGVGAGGPDQTAGGIRGGSKAAAAAGVRDGGSASLEARLAGKSPDGMTGRFQAALQELKAGALEMDYDRLCKVFDEVDIKQVPEEKRELWERLRKDTDNFDYDKVLSSLGSL